MEAVRFFADQDRATEFFVQIRWPDGVTCPHCGSTNVHYLANQRRWKCAVNHPRRQFSAKVGTIFEESPLPLDKWLVAIWLETNAKNSISSYEVGRALGITQKSAWFLLHRVRHALHVGSFDKKLCGTVEADETFIGGLAKNMHKSRRAKVVKGVVGSNKTTVMGLLERHSEKGKSKVRATVIPNTTTATLTGEIVKFVVPGSNVYTDAWQAYRRMPEEYTHAFVDHMEAYVKGAVHTNGLENFWSLLKRCIKGTHISVEPFHMAAYVDSEAFRFNNRDVKDADRFLRALGSVSGKRITYDALTGGPTLDRIESGRDGANERPNC